MELTHVEWFKNGKWRLASAEEVAKDWPEGVKVWQRLLRCRLCGQYVLLTRDSEKRIPHFRHSSEEARKDCEERSFSSGMWNSPSSRASFNPSDIRLPIKLELSSDCRDFRLSVGMIPLPQKTMMEKLRGKKLIFKAGNSSFVFLGDSLSVSSVTYLPLGNNPARNYIFSISPQVNNQYEIMRYWPQCIEGISDQGGLFDAISGKKLPPDSDVEKGQTCLLLIQTGRLGLYDSNLRSSNSCDLQKICTKDKWSLYRVTPNFINTNSTAFFSRFGVNLQETRPKIVPVWPLHVKTPYVIHHCSRNPVSFLIKGNAFPKVFPTSSLQVVDVEGKENWNVMTLTPDRETRQIVSLGRRNVIKYSYLWGDLDSLERSCFKKNASKIVVNDSLDKEIKEGEHYELPKQRRLYVKNPVYDGMFLIKKDSHIINKGFFKAGCDYFTIENIQYGVCVEIYYGLDLKWSAKYTEKTKPTIHVHPQNDDELYTMVTTMKGKKCKISHTLGTIAERMNDYPKTKGWLRQEIYKGEISESAFVVLKKTFLNNN